MNLTCYLCYVYKKPKFILFSYVEIYDCVDMHGICFYCSKFKTQLKKILKNKDINIYVLLQKDYLLEFHKNIDYIKFDKKISKYRLLK